MKKTLSLILAFVPLLGITPVPAATATEDASDQDSLYTSVEQQVQAFARSIYYEGADDDAAWALAKHGVLNRSTLKVGQSHALTVTLMNSMVMQSCLIKSLIETNRYMQLNGLNTMYCKGDAGWNPSSYGHYMVAYKDEAYSVKAAYVLQDGYQGDANQFDRSLEWIAGSIEVRYKIRRTAVDEKTVGYTVDVIAWDRFDFSGDNGSVSADLADLLGSFLFREFDWESTASFSLTVPNMCSHMPQKYHFVYDPQSRLFTTDISDGYSENATQRILIPHDTEIRYYYQLEKLIRLLHDKLWVVEYTMKPSSKMALTSTTRKDGGTPYLLHYRKDFFVVPILIRDDNGSYQAQHYYGTAFKPYF